MKWLALSFFFIFFVGCKAAKSELENNINTPVVASKDQIIFLNYSILFDKKKNQHKVELLNQIIRDGKLKSDYPEKMTSNPGDLLCVFLDQKKQPIKTIVIADPLKPVYEFVNDDGNFEKKQVEETFAEFSIRTQLNSRVHFVEILKQTSSKTTEKLLTSKIRS